MLLGQNGASDPNQGDVRWTQWGVLDGNTVRTLYSNHAEIARWPDQPSGEWPKGSGHSYVDGVATIISAATVDTVGRSIHPMSTNYREFIDVDPVEKTPWGWGPLPGYSNKRQESPARSDDPNSWPAFWPDKPLEYAGEWNGFFGRGIRNADVETYFVADDGPDKEWLYAKYNRTTDDTIGGVFYPDMMDSTRGGLGMEIRVRGFQWSHVLAQDVIFWLYEITNESTTDYDSVYFSQYIDWGIGGTDDSIDDEGGYNTYLDIAFAWDYNKEGQPGRWGPTGTVGFAFLESPGNQFNFRDDDEDGLIDEQRDNDAGEWLDEYPYGVNDVDAFREFYKREPRPHYAGDEDQDWYGYDDLNGSGTWDSNEPLNDDVGLDGLAPYHPNYPGPDEGEGNGRPDQGITGSEPNFGRTDKDESDQIGLTGFSVFDVHDFELKDDEENWREIFTKLQSPADAYLEGGTNLGMFFSSGPFPMPAGHTERFSMALIFAKQDFPDAPSPTELKNSSLARKKETVQQIYNADYRFAQPPLKPNLKAIPGDGQVILHWDERAEDSFDPFLKEYDFEGYKLYRSTEPFFNENRTITNAYGEETFRKELVQFDLDNEYFGLHAVAVDGTMFNLGNNTGLRHYYVDQNVMNGRTYYYALVSYDRGKMAMDADGNLQLDEFGHARGISPSECAATIKVDISGNIQVDINTVVVTPRPPATGYIPGELSDTLMHTWDEFSGPATGFVNLAVIQADSLLDNHEYELRFIESSKYHDEPTPDFVLLDLTDNTIVIDTTLLEIWGQETPVSDGLGMTIHNDTAISVIGDSSGWVEGSNSNYDITMRPLTRGDDLWGEFGNRKQLYPADYVIVFEDSVVDTSFQIGLGGPFQHGPIPVPFRIWNLTEQVWVPFGAVERTDYSYDNIWQFTEPIIILLGDSASVDPDPDIYNYRVAWAIRLFPPEAEDVTPIPPGAGDVIRIVTTKPFRDGETFRFISKGAVLDENLTGRELKAVYVVPNPYVATSLFEPANVYKSGRGERVIYFMGLPAVCKISIYTKRGYLVNTVTHTGSGPNGMESWDLVSKDGMNIAYGIYFYVVEAYGEKSVGKFAIIK